MTQTVLRICPLCEATCGLTLTISDGRVTGARGDRDDVFSRGFICPKGASFAELDNDRDRLTRPLVRRDGELTETTWDEAFAAVAEGLGAVIREHGGTSVGVYLGNPNAHTVAGALYPPVIIRGLGTHQVYSASTLDQMPKHVALGLMFGSPVAFTVPDLDRTDYLVIIGANPLVSNGSLATAADFPSKLRGSRNAAAGSSSSTPPAPALQSSPIATCRPARVPMRRCCWPSCTCCLTRAWSISGLWPTTSTVSTRSAPCPPISRRRPSPAIAACPPTRSAPSPASSLPRRRWRYMAESVPPQSNSERSAAGSSTSSTS